MVNLNYNKSFFFTEKVTLLTHHLCTCPRVGCHVAQQAIHPAGGKIRANVEIVFPCLKVPPWRECHRVRVKFFFEASRKTLLSKFQRTEAVLYLTVTPDDDLGGVFICKLKRNVL